MAVTTKEAITQESYEAQAEKILEKLAEVADDFYRLYTLANESEGEDEQEDAFFYTITRQVGRAKKNFELAQENIELAFDLPIEA